jgi:hypothetical protein
MGERPTHDLGIVVWVGERTGFRVLQWAWSYARMLLQLVTKLLRIACLGCTN